MRLKIGMSCEDPRDMEGALKTRALLETLELEFNLKPYIYTDHIQIHPMAIPHSHPILTLNTRYAGDRNGLLSCFLHEQFHWYCVQRNKDVETALHEIKKMFPVVPSGPGSAGARDEEST